MLTDPQRRPCGYQKKFRLFNIYGPAEASLWSARTTDLLNQTIIPPRKRSQTISEIQLNIQDQFKFNETKADYPKDICIHTLFEQQVCKTPGATAVIAEDGAFTYRELNETANRIAHGLIQKGIEIGDVVAIKLPRNKWLLPVILSILKSGAVYLPMDLEIPAKREQTILDDSNPRFYITMDNLLDFLSDNKKNPCISISSEALCYCIYTSGSTGTPKGVLIRHRNIVNFCSINDMNTYQKDFHKSVHNSLSLFKYIFDVFSLDWTLTLLHGKALVLTKDSAIADGRMVGELIETHHVDSIQITPSVFKQLCKSDYFISAIKDIQLFLFGGEPLTEDIASIVFTHTNAAVYNGYGPSETTLASTFGKITPQRD